MSQGKKDNQIIGKKKRNKNEEDKGLARAAEGRRRGKEHLQAAWKELTQRRAAALSGDRRKPWLVLLGSGSSKHRYGQDLLFLLEHAHLWISSCSACTVQVNPSFAESSINLH